MSPSIKVRFLMKEPNRSRFFKYNFECLKIEIIDTHLERLCAKTALDELTKDAMPKKSESRKGLSLESGPAKKKLK